jgi:hypothetical protein
MSSADINNFFAFGGADAFGLTTVGLCFLQKLSVLWRRRRLYVGFYNEPGRLNPEGLAKFDPFLVIAEAAGIDVHPTGPELWEGPADWAI